MPRDKTRRRMRRVASWLGLLPMQFLSPAFADTRPATRDPDPRDGHCQWEHSTQRSRLYNYKSRANFTQPHRDSKSP
ncbi:uncharacterized protein B0I36DRAFT_320146 [Microdochium trichocladiopsis]|uniref:Secreted protein n=1 Tax=Microdochium trichocladiopsis TaxID=1682393 RepID=A0A9P8Y8P7_9PEZI|nr:uncharacterized protein B0I36DRAFT_320146 [Microdochium trichocladiopsis]KAH7032840.1 hypothetical protein B0I36DRAFT_320146 [Microdochium trichocladiopsis]